VQTPPYRRVDLEEQDVELVNFGRSVWLDHSRPRSLVVALFSPRFFPVSFYRSGFARFHPIIPKPGLLSRLNCGFEMLPSFRCAPHIDLALIEVCS
jgi:hypothetical protein